MVGMCFPLFNQYSEVYKLTEDKPMQDLTQYGSAELALLVFNTEYLYNSRHNEDLIDILDELFIYTLEQLDELVQDLEEDQDND